MVFIKVDQEVTLRQYVRADAEALFGLVQRSRQHLSPWLGWVEQTTKVEHSIQFIDDMHYQAETQDGLALGIFLDQDLVGGLGLHHWDHKLNCAQIGYWIAPEHEGKGIMLRSLKALTAFLFEQVSLNKIEIHFVTANTRSRNLAERAGYKVEGIIRQGALRNGLIEDLVIAGMLRSEWRF